MSARVAAMLSILSKGRAVGKVFRLRPQRPWALAALLIAVVWWGPATPCASAEDSFAPGSWYTQGLDERGDYLQAFVTFDHEGKFQKFIRILHECKVVGQWIESGNWTLANWQLQFITDLVDGKKVEPTDEYYLNTFKVTISGPQAHIFDLETSHSWILKAAAPPFEFPHVPDCAVA